MRQSFIPHFLVVPCLLNERCKSTKSHQKLIHHGHGKTKGPYDIHKQYDPFTGFLIPNLMDVAIIEDQTFSLLPMGCIVADLNAACGLGFGHHEPKRELRFGLIHK